MATKIVTKNSSTASAVPTASDLVQGELAVNVADKRLFTEDNAGAIVELGTNPSTLTVTGEITANGGIALGDNDKATFGAGDDLQIYHNGGSGNYIDSVNKDLYIRCNLDAGIAGGDILLQPKSGENSAIFKDNGAVDLYYDNVAKFSTTATGIDVTGTADVTLDLNVGGAVKGNAGTRAVSVGAAGSVNGGIQLWSTTAGTSYVQFGDEAGTAANHYRGYMAYNHANDSMALGTSGSTKVTVSSSGDVGIGGTPNSYSGQTALTINSTGVARLDLDIGNTNQGYLLAENGYIGLYAASGKYVSMGVSGSGEAIRIDSSGNVGIGVSPSSEFHVKGDANTIARIEPNNNSGKATLLVSSTASGDGGIQYDANNNQTNLFSYSDMTFNVGTGNVSGGYPANERMRIDSSGDLNIVNTGQASLNYTTDGSLDYARITGGKSGSGVGDLRFFTYSGGIAERMRIDSSGNLLVGKTANDNSTVGGSLRAGESTFTAGNSRALTVGRNTGDGELIQFRKGTGSVGAIGTNGGNLQFMSGSVGVGVGGDNLYPTNGSGSSTDASLDIGDASARFKDLYRSGSTISTSDGNMKQDIRDLTDAERNVAVAAKGLLKAFRFIDRVEEEGDSANIHFGIIAQDLAAAFTAEGLDAKDYQVYRADTFTDDDGNEQTRLGICYENLLAFIISAI